MLQKSCVPCTKNSCVPYCDMFQQLFLAARDQWYHRYSVNFLGRVRVHSSISVVAVSSWWRRRNLTTLYLELSSICALSHVTHLCSGSYHPSMLGMSSICALAHVIHLCLGSCHFSMLWLMSSISALAHVIHLCSGSCHPSLLRLMSSIFA